MVSLLEVQIEEVNSEGIVCCGSQLGVGQGMCYHMLGSRAGSTAPGAGLGGVLKPCDSSHQTSPLVHPSGRSEVLENKECVFKRLLQGFVVLSWECGLGVPREAVVMVALGWYETAWGGFRILRAPSGPRQWVPGYEEARTHPKETDRGQHPHHSPCYGSSDRSATVPKGKAWGVCEDPPVSWGMRQCPAAWET